jgi:serine/threonine protein kinase/WD40 repeat protein
MSSSADAPLDWWLERFEQAWETGVPPPLVEHLPGADAGLRRAVLIELVLVDLEQRWRRGRRSTAEEGTGPLRLEDYCRRHPELESTGPLPLECIVQEYRVRRRWGDAPGHHDYLQRFPGRDEELLPALRGVDRAPTDRADSWGTALPAGPLSPRVAVDGQDDFLHVPGYEVLEEIGRGGMGVVYKARQAALGRIVALKMLPERSQLDPKVLARFEQEAAVVAQVQHANVVQIHEIGSWAGRPYLCLEFVDGGSLARHLGGTPLKPDDAARLLETLARAAAAVHERGIVHRDLKPANILLQRKSQITSHKSQKEAGAGNVCDLRFEVCDFVPKIADFGLARYVDEPGLTQTGSILGTPSYMAPEQAAGDSSRVGPLADVYALGAILYECLTGRPPFRAATVLETLEQVRSQEPVPVRRLQPQVQRDLETICLKSLHKDPSRRYAGALDLADDLARFLRHEPIRARPVSSAERFLRWCRNHPATAGPLAGVFLLLLALTGLLYHRTREQEREVLLQQVQVLLGGIERESWRTEIHKKVEAAARIRRDRLLRDLAVSSLANLDARPGPALREYRAAGVVFDHTGRRLLLGGTNDKEARPEAPATLWEPETGARHTSAHLGAGPVAFRATDDVPLQLLARAAPKPAVLLWDVAHQRKVCEGHFKLDGVAAQKWKFVIDDVDRELLALAGDGSLLAAALEAEGQGLIGIWDGASGQLLRQIPARATALAFLPGRAGEAARLVVGDAQGNISFWPVRGNGAPGSVLRQGRTAIHALAFREPHLLAAGDAGGTITLWQQSDSTWHAVTRCLGSLYDVHALAFSPDNQTLASGGRYHVCLWDVTTGRLLLRVRAGSYITGVAFAPSAGDPRLAVTTTSYTTARENGAWLWVLEPDQGLATLRGLTTPVAVVRLSPDGQRLAAMAQDWRIALWEVRTGTLLRFLEAPPGDFVDNAALAFRNDGRQLAFAGGRHACLWDTETGKQLASWTFPTGLQDRLAFDSADRLRSFRVETRDGLLPPYSNAPPDKHPRVIKLRELRVSGESPVVRIVSDFNYRVLQTLPVPPGNRFLALGDTGSRDNFVRHLKAFEWDGERPRWQIALPPIASNPDFLLDPDGQVAAVNSEDEQKGTLLIDPVTRTELGRVPRVPGSYFALGPGGHHLVAHGNSRRDIGRGGGLSLFRRGWRPPLVTLGDRTMPKSPPTFDRTGNLLAWGNQDGTVTVCNLPRIRAGLRLLGLDWEE